MLRSAIDLQSVGSQALSYYYRAMTIPRYADALGGLTIWNLSTFNNCSAFI